MMKRRTLAVVAFGMVFSAHVVHGQDFSQYRGYKLGADLPSVSLLAKLAATEAKTIHSRPALIQRMEWRPPYFQGGSSAPQADTVRQIAFSFYNDQLSRITVDYENNRTAGMTDTDMIEAISTTYGPAGKTPARTPLMMPTRLEEQDGTAIARWGDVDHAIVLYRTSYASGFRIVLTSPRLEGLARTAADQASLLDEREAPQRENARKKQEMEDTRAAQEKARTENKAAFRP